MHHRRVSARLAVAVIHCHLRRLHLYSCRKGRLYLHELRRLGMRQLVARLDRLHLARRAHCGSAVGGHELRAVLLRVQCLCCIPSSSPHRAQVVADGLLVVRELAGNVRQSYRLTGVGRRVLEPRDE